MIEILDVAPFTPSSSSESAANALQNGGTISPNISAWPWMVVSLVLVVVIAVLAALLIKEKEKHSS